MLDSVSTSRDPTCRVGPGEVRLGFSAAATVFLMSDVAPPWSGQSGWHLAQWGLWGWAETLPKLIAIVAAVIAALAGGAWNVPDNHQLSFWLLVVVAMGYVGTIADRWIDKEIFAMSFVVLMLIGHWSLVYAMGQPEWPSGRVRLFAGLMLAGDVVKIGYFATTRARVRGLSPVIPILMTSVLATAYLVALIAA